MAGLSPPKLNGFDFNFSKTLSAQKNVTVGTNKMTLPVPPNSRLVTETQINTNSALVYGYLGPFFKERISSMSVLSTHLAVGNEAAAESFHQNRFACLCRLLLLLLLQQS